MTKFINPLSIIKLIEKNPKWLDWEPETIWRDIDDIYQYLPKGQPVFPGIFKDIVIYYGVSICLTHIHYVYRNNYDACVLISEGIRIDESDFLSRTK